MVICPNSAITEENRSIGVVEKGEASHLEFVQGKLNIGEPMATPVVRAVKDEIDKEKITILDASPGTGCPVIETISGSDYCLLVTEPTPFGLYDLKLAVEVVRNLRIPFGIIVNRWGGGDSQLEDYCLKENIPILLKIPFSRDIAMLYSKGIPLIQAHPHWKANFLELFKGIEEEIR